MTKRIIRGLGRGSVAMPARQQADVGDVAKTLMEFWTSRHAMISDEGALPDRDFPRDRSLKRMTLCRQLGRCVCGPGHADVLARRRSVVTSLKNALKKATPGRKQYDFGRAVLHLFSHKGAAAHHISSFCFLGSGNLTSGVFYLHEFVPPSDDHALASVSSSSGLVLLPEGVPMEIFDVLDKLPRRKELHADVYVLETLAAEAIAAFVPLAVVSRCSAVESMQIWPLPVSGRRSSAQALLEIMY